MAEESLLERRRFRCDDAAGFELLIVRANDGDFHLSVVPNREDFNHEHEGEEQFFAGCYSASVRIRAPMIGGGAHEALWYALVKLFKATRSTAAVAGKGPKTCGAAWVGLEHLYRCSREQGHAGSHSFDSHTWDEPSPPAGDAAR